jgi:hypothetical protein
MHDHDEQHYKSEGQSGGENNERDCFDADLLEVLPPQRTCVERLLPFTGNRCRAASCPFKKKSPRQHV